MAACDITVSVDSKWNIRTFQRYLKGDWQDLVWNGRDIFFGLLVEERRAIILVEKTITLAASEIAEGAPEIGVSRIGEVSDGT